jgi:hypothetical protein
MSKRISHSKKFDDEDTVFDYELRAKQNKEHKLIRQVRREFKTRNYDEFTDPRNEEDYG